MPFNKRQCPSVFPAHRVSTYKIANMKMYMDRDKEADTKASQHNNIKSWKSPWKRMGFKVEETIAYSKEFKRGH